VVLATWLQRGVRSPCVFSLLEAHAMGPPCVGPPQLGVVADGNATLGRLIAPSLLYWEGFIRQPRWASFGNRAAGKRQ